MIVASIIMVLLWYETVFWSIVLSRHTHKIRVNPEYHYRHGEDRKTHHRKSDDALASMTGMARMVSILSGIFSSILMIIWIIFLVNSDNLHWPVRTFTFAGTLLTLIHFFVILARCSDLPRRFWPLASQYVSKYILKRKYPEETD